MLMNFGDIQLEEDLNVAAIDSVDLGQRMVKVNGLTFDDEEGFADL